MLRPGREAARANLEGLAARARAAGASPFFISGNHDPDETPHTFADLLGGLVHVTHGDALFEKIVPWALDGDYLAELRNEEMSRHPFGSRTDVALHLAATRQAVRRLHSHLSMRRREVGRFRFWLERMLFLPRKVWRTPVAWRETPELARRYLRQFRPHTRFIAMGHTHKVGATLAGRRVILNTGSFQYGLGAAAVDVTAERVVLRRIVRSAGAWRAAEALATYRTADFPLLAGAPGSEALS